MEDSSRLPSRWWNFVSSSRAASSRPSGLQAGFMKHPETDDALSADSRPHVVIVGAGFGGLMAAKTLAQAPVRITLIDRRNHHLFQPLLYQVATAGLAPAQIAAPIRAVFRHQKNVTVLLGEVTAVDLGRQEVVTEHKREPFDYLVIATSAHHSYF